MAEPKKDNAKPKASRPRMKGYGVPKSMAGALPWTWARERLSKSHNYWLTTVRPAGVPHTMPLWGIWLDSAFYFSTGTSTRKARNLQHNPNCVVCNENSEEAVILEGVAQKLKDSEIPARAFVDYKTKYGWELDPQRGSVFVVRPKVVFAMPEKLFPKGATRWQFSQES
ncbi:MAG TPA: pyridoxamine 5'-phosphate oxidase family protein [Candidatus Binatia bacterium]|nr:pyridoxamine 5'-phosphate oxidase family protein [Candidatus Binatia bacterium]